MFVRDLMSAPAVTITPDANFQDALQTMRKHNFRRLPVVDKKGRLAGIVSERDLLHAAPSPASSLSVWELNYLLSRLTVQQVMTRAIIITTPDTPIEHAASLMVANKVGGLPVVDNHDRVVGVITETDIFTAFVNMLDGEDGGVRLTLEVPDGHGIPFTLVQSLAGLGAELVSLGVFGHVNGRQRMLMVLKGVTLRQLQEHLHLEDVLVTSAMETPEPAIPYTMPLRAHAITHNGARL